MGDLLDDIVGGSGFGGGNGSSGGSGGTDSYGYNGNASSAMYQLYEPRFSVAAALGELRARWDDRCYGGFSKVWCERCDEVGTSSTRLLEVTYAAAPHAICLLLLYLTLRARLNNFVQVDTREREAVALRRALAVLEGKAALPAAA